MSIITRPKRWGGKPPVGTQIAWGHPLSNGLAEVILFNEAGGQPRSLITGEAATTIGSPIPSWSNSSGTTARLYTGSSIDQFVDAPRRQITGAVSLAFSVIPTGAGWGEIVARRTILGAPTFIDYGVNLNIGANIYQMFWTNGGNYITYSIPAPAANVRVSSCWTRSFNVARAYNNGNLVGTSGGLSSPDSTTAPLSIGGIGDGASELFFGSMFYVYIWNRALSATEIQQVYVDPYSFLEPQTGNSRYFIPTVAAGATLAQTLSATMATRSATVARATARTLPAATATNSATVAKATAHTFFGARRNLFDSSEDLTYFPNSGVGYNAPNATAAPNGAITADTAREDVGTTEHAFFRFTGLAGGTYSLSFFLKKATNTNWVHLRCRLDSTDTRTWFDILNGVIGTQGHTGATITNAGNGWWRCSVTFTAGGVTNIGWGFASADAVWNYAGNTANTVFAWGAQLEVGSLSAYQVMPGGDTPSPAAFAGAAVKSTSHPLTASMGSWSAALARAFVRLVTLTASMGAWSGATAKAALRTITASMDSTSWSGVLRRSTARALSATQASLAGSVARFTARAINALPGSWAAALNRSTGRTLSAAKAAWSAALSTVLNSATHLYFQTLNASMGAWAAVTSKLTFRGLNAGQPSFAGAVSKSTTRALNAGLSGFAATLAAIKIKMLIMSASMAAWSGSINRSTSRTLPAQIGFGGSVSRSTARAIAASSSSWVAGVGKGVRRSLTAAMGGWAGTLGRLLTQIANYVPRIRFRFGSESRRFRVPAEIRTFRLEEKRTTKIQ